MRKILCFILFAVFIVVLSHPASGQRLGRGGPILGDLFQEGQPPPPGAVSVLGRSVLGAIENGFDSSLALIMGADDQNVRRELGLTDTEVNSVRLLRAQMLLNSPQYANRFKTMTEETQGRVQADLSRDLGRITEYLNNSLSQERRENVQRFVFQASGGLDSPIVSLNSMEVLNLSETQRGQMKAVFDEMRDERVTQMEKMLGIAEKVVAAGGPQNLPEEEQEQLRKAGEELRDQSLATARRLTERLRQHLTPEQLERERQLIASRPAFLPPLPRELRRENHESTGGGDDFVPGPGAWRPGQDLPLQLQERRGSRFPRGETGTE